MVAAVPVRKLAKRINDFVAFARAAAALPGGSALPDTTQASTTIDALTPGRVYRFRARARTRAGIGALRKPLVFLAP
jgi:hypothetical protein